MATESEDFKPQIKSVLLALANGDALEENYSLDREYVVEDEKGTTTITYEQLIRVVSVQKEQGHEDSPVG